LKAGQKGQGDAVHNPNSPQAIWGRELKYYREAAGLTQPQLAEIINYDPSVISRIENGKIPAAIEFAKACDAVPALGTNGTLTRTLDYRKGEVFPSWFDWPKHEAEAVRLRIFQNSLVHGLLQTPAYARAVLYGDETKVAGRIQRQSILTRDDPPTPHLTCLLDELVLHHNPGGDREMMKEQLLHLAASESSHTHVQIVPNGIAHPGSVGAFVIATPDDGHEVAYCETATRGVTTGNPDDLRTLNTNFDEIRSHALPVEQSIDLIQRTAEERWS
jgi:transcriptional regulator with XRE-family HTH domain